MTHTGNGTDIKHPAGTCSRRLTMVAYEKKYFEAHTNDKYI